jgi:hypothetical protein
MKIPWILFLAIFLFGCASQKASIRSLPAENQDSIFVQGGQALVSQGQHVAMVRALDQTIEIGSHLRFSVLVLNRGNEGFVFSAEDISAFTARADGEIVGLQVFTQEQLVEFERSRQRRMAFALALQAFGDSMSAQRSSVQHHQGMFHGPTGSGFYSGTTTGRGTASAAQAEIQARTQQRGAQIRAEADASIRELSETLLLKQTVFPESYNTGTVVISAPQFSSDVERLTLLIMVGEEEHEFQFEMTRME